jgi:serine/threonine protein kinase
MSRNSKDAITHEYESLIRSLNASSLTDKPIQNVSQTMDGGALKTGIKMKFGGESYIIDKVLGRGAFKRAWLAHKKRDPTQSVVIYEQTVDDKESNKMFNYEVKKITMLQNKLSGKCIDNIICPIYVRPAGFLNKKGVIVTNYFAGVDLEVFCNNSGALSVDKILKIAGNMIRAFNVLHNELKIVHLDIKPANIMINPDTLEVGIIDIGLSCDFIEDSKCSIIKTNGTFLFLAPEAFTRFNVKGDVRKLDVWALGCTLYELLYRHPMLRIILGDRLVNEYPDSQLAVPAFLLPRAIVALYKSYDYKQIREEFKNGKLERLRKLNYGDSETIRQVNQLICDMTEYYPEKRASLDNVEYRLKQITDDYHVLHRKWSVNLTHAPASPQMVQSGGTGDRSGQRQYRGRPSSVMVKVPKNVQKTAAYAFKLRKLGFEGATETGWKRAKQLATKDTIPIEDLRYMRNWFARHIYTSYPGYKNWVQAGRPKDKSWHKKHAIQSWITWTGSAGFKWVNSKRVIRLLNTQFRKRYKRIKG